MRIKGFVKDIDDFFLNFGFIQQIKFPFKNCLLNNFCIEYPFF